MDAGTPEQFTLSTPYRVFGPTNDTSFWRRLEKIAPRYFSINEKPVFENRLIALDRGGQLECTKFAVSPWVIS